MKTYVLNFFGGSGLGKSTTAAAVYAELKYQGQHCELVREFVKEMAWAGVGVGPFGQNIIYGRQLERESALYNKVDFIVTDSPLLLCPIYQNHYAGHDTIKQPIFKDLEMAKTLGVTHINFLLKRHKPFDPRGRYETEDKAKLIDKKVEAFLLYHGIDVITIEEDDRVRIPVIVEKALQVKAQNQENLK